MKKIIIVTLLLVTFKLELLANSSETIGDIFQILIPASSYATTLFLDDKEGQTEFYKSFGTNIAITYTLKYSIDKKRPNGHKHAFPSGHTSAAFQGASFMHVRYGFKYSIPLYVGAIYTAYSRIESDNHDEIDVIAGAVIGTLSSYYFTSKYKGYEIKPIALNKGYGVILSRSF